MAKTKKQCVEPDHRLCTYAYCPFEGIPTPSDAYDTRAAIQDYDAATRIYMDNKSSEYNLRRALAFCLGYPGDPKIPSKLFQECRMIWDEYFAEKTMQKPTWSATLDSKSLRSILLKLRKQFSPEPLTADHFRAYLQNLPEWFQQNGLALRTLDGSFSNIIARELKAAAAKKGFPPPNTTNSAAADPSTVPNVSAAAAIAQDFLSALKN